MTSHIIFMYKLLSNNNKEIVGIFSLSLLHFVTVLFTDNNEKVCEQKL